MERAGTDTGGPLVGSGPADETAVKEFWTEVVRSAADRGKLEKIPTRQATNARERKTAQLQNQAITRRSYGAFHPNYTHIRWRSREGL